MKKIKSIIRIKHPLDKRTNQSNLINFLEHSKIRTFIFNKGD